MLKIEGIVKQFAWGVSILTAYLKYNNKINYTDINILSEGFSRDLLNILLGLKLKNARKQNSPGYDLISEQERIIVQVSTTCTPQKINHTFRALENTISESIRKKNDLEQRLKEIEKRSYLGSKEVKREEERVRQEMANIVDIRGYRVIFLFLSENADAVRKYGQKGHNTFDIPATLTFCQETDIFSFDSLIRIVSNLSPDSEARRVERLRNFMNRNANLFIRRNDIQPSRDKVSQIINEYARNFCEPLFLHRFTSQSHVTLKNLFVEPSLSSVNGEPQYPNNIIFLLDSFIWDHDKDRLMFIDGDAAIGKTSLISWLCYHYSELDDVGKSIFLDTQLVCVRLRDISLSHGESAEACILRYLSFNNMNDFEEEYGNALIVLEGADELGLLGGIGALTIEQFILNVRHAFYSHKIVITSRPKFINMEAFSGLSQTFSYQHYSLNHFSKKQRDSWIENYESNEKCGQTIPEGTKQYLSQLSSEEAAGVADTPLALYLLVACEVTETLKNNKWALYDTIFHNAIRHTPYNESFRGGVNTQYHNALRDDDFAETVYQTIGKIANRMFENSHEERFYISSDELDDIISKLNVGGNNEEIKAIRKCCVLCAYWKENTNTGALEFYHNNIRDFFMCEYIYQRFFNTAFPTKPEAVAKQLIETACEVFQHGMIAQTTWAQTFSFLYFRLQYEKCTKGSAASTTRNVDIEALFPYIIHSIINNDTMWKYAFDGQHYESAKSTFLNFALFLRIWISSIASEKLETFTAETYYEFWHGKGVFEDWIRLFSDTIEISNRKYIAFGSQMKFSNMDFKQARLVGACYEESEFVDSCFENADLNHANFCAAYLKNVDFTGSDLHNADFSNAILIGVNFSSANLRNACFENALLQDVIWPEKSSCMDGANFSKAHIRNAKWKTWKLKNIEFTYTKFENCSFHKMQFYASAASASFHGCSISNTIFESACSLAFQDMNSNLSDIHFRGEIKGCSFRDVTLKDSSWTDANLDNINFTHTKINNIEFRGSIIRSITFDGCTIDGSVDVFKAQMSDSVKAYLIKYAKKLLNVATIITHAN